VGSGWVVVLVPFGFVVVLPGVVVVLPGIVVVLVLPGNVFALPGVVVLPDVVVSVLDPVLEVPVDEPMPELLEPGVPVVVLVPMPVLVSVVPVEGLVVVSLPVVVDERGLVVELPVRGGVGAERPSGEPLRELDVSVLVPMLPDEEVPTP